MTYLIHRMQTEIMADVTRGRFLRWGFLGWFLVGMLIAAQSVSMGYAGCWLQVADWAGETWVEDSWVDAGCWLAEKQRASLDRYPFFSLFIRQKKRQKPTASLSIKKKMFTPQPHQSVNDDGEAQSVGSNPRHTNPFDRPFSIGNEDENRSLLC